MKKILWSILMFATMLCLCFGASAADEEQSATSNNMNFDVIFVIDGSGSMKHSDELKLRLTAGKLFTDLAASNTSRAGYVQFTNIIMESVGLTDLSTEENKAAFGNRLASLKDADNPDYDDTDISLGITEGLRLLKEGGSFNNDRNPVIVLISDGNTDIPTGKPRTVADSDAELPVTLAEAASLGVPIYAIGLNWDGQLKEAYLQNISDTTGGKFYNITTASEFNKNIMDIFGNVADGSSTKLSPEYRNGRYYTNFVIDNSSVLTANIVVLTDKGVSDPRLTGPDGSEVPMDAEHGVIVSTDVSDANHASTYTILKIMYPAQGVWNVSVQGEADDAIEVNLLTTYDIDFMIFAPEDAIAGQNTTLTGYLMRGDEAIKDTDLLNEGQAFCIIVDENGNTLEENSPMTYDPTNAVFTYGYNFPESGNYYITAHLEGRKGTFSKQSSQYRIAVKRMPLVVNGSVQKKMWSNPIKTKASFQLGDVVSCESLLGLSCSLADEQNSIASVDYNNETGVVTLTPRTTGKQQMSVRVLDGYGQEAVLTVEVNILPSWIWFLLAAIVLLLIAGIILLIMRKNRPVLSDPLTVELTMPPALLDLTPAPIPLGMPARKSEILLSKLIAADQVAQTSFGEPIQKAGLWPLMEKVLIKADKGGRVSVKILPKLTGVATIAGQAVDNKKGMISVLRKGDKLSIHYSVDGMNSSVVNLTLGQADADGVGGPLYGNGSIGFDDKTFGSPFGSGSDSFGGSSGFGDSGSFGGFNGFDSSDSFGGFGTDFDNYGDSQKDFHGGSDSANNGWDDYNSTGDFDSAFGGSGHADKSTGRSDNSDFNFGGGDFGDQNGSDDGFVGF